MQPLCTDKEIWIYNKVFYITPQQRRKVILRYVSL